MLATTRVKNNPKSIQIVPKSSPNRLKNVLGAGFGGLGGVWASLGGCWKIWGRFFDRKNRQDGPKFASKMESTWHQNRFKNLLEFICFLGSVVGRILLGFGKDNAAKLVQK